MDAHRWLRQVAQRISPFFFLLPPSFFFSLNPALQNEWWEPSQKVTYVLIRVLRVLALRPREEVLGAGAVGVERRERRHLDGWEM